MPPTRTKPLRAVAEQFLLALLLCELRTSTDVYTRAYLNVAQVWGKSLGVLLFCVNYKLVSKIVKLLAGTNMKRGWRYSAALGPCSGF